VWLALVEDNGSNSIVLAAGANATLNVNQIEAATSATVRHNYCCAN
jgi:hypothetical protein